MMEKCYLDLFEEHFDEFTISKDFYLVCRKKCIEFDSLTYDRGYLYIYVRKVNATILGQGDVEYVTGYTAGFDYWSAEDTNYGAPPAGRMSSYGDEHLYVPVI